MILRHTLVLSGVLVASVIFVCVSTILIAHFFPSSVTVYDPELFADPTCVLPCWQNLHVGESTLAEVETVFNDIAGHEMVTYTNCRAEFDDAYLVDASVRDETLFRIKIWSTGMTLNDMISHLGTPDYLAVHIVENIDTLAPPMWANAEIYYVEQGLIFELGADAQRMDNGANVCLHENMWISTVIMTEAGNIDYLISGLYFGERSTQDVSLYRDNLLRDWQDFGCAIYPYFS